MLGLKIRVGAETDNAEKNLDQTAKKIGGLGKAAEKSRRAMSKLGPALKKVGIVAAAAATAAGVAMAALGRSSSQTIDNFAKMARTVNTSVGSLQVLARAGELSGVAMEQAEVGVKDFFRRLSQAAATGAGPAVDALKALNLTVEELNDLPMDERIALVNKRLKELVPAAQQAAVAGALFGEEASLLLTRLDASVIAEARAELEAFGAIVSDIDAAQIERTNDAMSQIGLVMEGFGNRIAVSVAPALERMSDHFADSAKKGGSFYAMTEVVSVGLSSLIKWIHATGVGISYIPSIAVEAFGRVNSALGALRLWFESMAGQIQYSWSQAMISLRTEWMELLQDMEATSIGSKIPGLTESINTMSDSIGAARKEAQKLAGAMVTDAAAADLAWDNATARMETVNALIAEIKDIFAETGTTAEETGAKVTAAVTGAVQALGKVKEKVTETKEAVKTGLSDVEEAYQRLGENIQYTLEDTLMAIAEGTGSTKQIFKAMARDIIRELYRVLVVQRLVGSFGGGGNVGGGLLGMIGGAFGFGSPGNPLAIAGASSGVGSYGLPASFEGGGYTGSGPRSGGMDGRGGFPAILHPNETVIDHRGPQGGAGVIVNQTINVSTGVQATVRSEIINMMPQIAESSKMAVLEARQRGGAFAEAFR